MPERIFIRRETTDTPFGFKLQGGSDFSIPLSILQITPNSIADFAGLRPGDAILKINDADISWMDHNHAKMEIIRAGNDFNFTIERNSVDLTKPQHTPLSQLKINPPQNLSNYAPPPPLPKTDLTVEKHGINIGTSHNRAPMPFNTRVGNGIDYKSAKPTNWTEGDYTKWSQNNEQVQKEQAKGVFHSQYNTPIGMYSDSNVFQEFQNQTKSLIPQTTSSFQNQNFNQQTSSNNGQVKGVNSLSMKMLNQGIQDAHASYVQPPSVFDLKRGDNPTGATVPRGFKSVQAPGPLPQEQRHAPTRVEYQVKHVKQNWVEPKIN